MAKFAVGETCVHVTVRPLGMSPQARWPFKDGEHVRILNTKQDRHGLGIEYAIESDAHPLSAEEDGLPWWCPECDLRKLPGDSTSLPSWLTNMLKVPQGDPDKVKQPEQVK